MNCQPKHKIGEKVRATFNSFDHEGTVKAIYHSYNEPVYIIDFGHSFYLAEIPFSECYVTKVKEPIRLGDYTVTIEKDAIHVGCTKVTRNQIQEILARMDEEPEKKTKTKTKKQKTAI